MKNYDLQAITHRVARREITRLQNIARDYFYVHDVKSIELKALSMQEIYNKIVVFFKLDTTVKNHLKRGLTKRFGDELIVSLGRKNISLINEDNKTYYKLIFENADYNNVAHKRKRDNVITQKKEQVKISIQLDKDLRDVIREYCDTKGFTMSNIVREHFKELLEKEKDNHP